MRNLLLALVSLFSLNASAGSMTVPWFVQGETVKAIKPNISLQGDWVLLTGTDDPTVVPKSGGPGSMYCITTAPGTCFTKQDSGLTTNWAVQPTTVTSGLIGRIAYVNSSGSDVPGCGPILKPCLTPDYFESQITDGGLFNQYVLNFGSGDYTLGTGFVKKPFIHWQGNLFVSRTTRIFTTDGFMPIVYSGPGNFRTNFAYLQFQGGAHPEITHLDADGFQATTFNNVVVNDSPSLIVNGAGSDSVTFTNASHFGGPATVTMSDLSFDDSSGNYFSLTSGGLFISASSVGSVNVDGAFSIITTSPTAGITAINSSFVVSDIISIGDGMFNSPISIDGTSFLLNLSTTFGVSYTPTTPSDWPIAVPTNATEGLDFLAANKLDKSGTSGLTINLGSDTPALFAKQSSGQTAPAIAIQRNSGGVDGVTLSADDATGGGRIILGPPSGGPATSSNITVHTDNGLGSFIVFRIHDTTDGYNLFEVDANGNSFFREGNLEIGDGGGGNVKAFGSIWDESFFAVGGSGTGTLPDQRLADAALFIGNGHLQVNDAIPPAAVVNANAGTGATCSMTLSGDTAGTVTLITGSAAFASGDQCDITFQVPFFNAPKCSVTPANATAGLNAGFFYETKSTTALSLNFAVAPIAAQTFIYDYICLESSNTP